MKESTIINIILITMSMYLIIYCVGRITDKYVGTRKIALFDLLYSSGIINITMLII